jgi:hypothetical protein
MNKKIQSNPKAQRFSKLALELTAARSMGLEMQTSEAKLPTLAMICSPLQIVLRACARPSLLR